MKTNGIRWCASKNWWILPAGDLYSTGQTSFLTPGTQKLPHPHGTQGYPRQTGSYPRDQILLAHCYHAIVGLANKVDKMCPCAIAKHIFNSISFGDKTMLKVGNRHWHTHALTAKQLLSIQMRKPILQHTPRFLVMTLDMDSFDFGTLIICFPMAHLVRNKSCKASLNRAPAWSYAIY